METDNGLSGMTRVQINFNTKIHWHVNGDLIIDKLLGLTLTLPKQNLQKSKKNCQFPQLRPSHARWHVILLFTTWR